MKQLVILGVIVLCIFTAINTNALETVIFFILTGHLDVLNLTIPPLVMLLLWVFIVPISVFVYHTTNNNLWLIIETIGKLHQRHINRTQRWITKHVPSKASILPLIVIAMIHISNNSPSKTTNSSLLYFRRNLGASQTY